MTEQPSGIEAAALKPFVWNQIHAYEACNGTVWRTAEEAMKESQRARACPAASGDLPTRKAMTPNTEDVARLVAELRSRNLFFLKGFSYFQSNIEGALIDEVQRVGFDYNGIVINPGGYTHTSVALGDAIAAIKAPVIEVHISNVHKREEFRHHSYLSPVCSAVIVGAGVHGYALAVSALANSLA
jgi:3-dehydroquinate dehydratase-2